MAVTENVMITFKADGEDVKKTFDEIAKKIVGVKTETEKLVTENKTLKKSYEEALAQGKNVDELTRKLADNEVAIRASKKELQLFQSTIDNVKTKQLNDELEQLNRQVNKLDPAAKAQAFVKFGNSVAGALQIATGAVQALGAESEELQKLGMRLQGALNVAQGIASLKDLKDSYKDLKVLLGVTTAAQTTLTTATTAGGVATTGASAALRGFAASLSATGIGAIVVALGALVGAMIALGSETDETAKKSERLLEIEAERARLAGDEVAASRALKLLKGELTEDAAKRLETEDEINKQIAKTSSDLAKLITNNKAIIQQYQTFAEQGREQEFFAAFSDEAGDVIRQYFALQENLVQLRKTAVTQLQVVDEQANQNKKKTDEKANEDAKKADEKRIADAKARREKAAADALKELQDNQASIDAQAAATAALGQQFEQELAAQLKAIDDKASLDIRASNLFISNLEDRKATEQALELQALEDKKKKLIEFGKDTTDIELQIAEKRKEIYGTDKANYDKATADKLKADLERSKLAEELFVASQDFILSLSQSYYQREQQDLEQQKEKGIITEEQYQAKLKQIKLAQARQDKELAIFSATVAFAEALVKALTTKNPPAALLLAAAVGGLNLAKIIATPLPKFKHGTLSVPGTDTGQDTVMAMLRPGEAVIPTETNREYAPALRAIYRRDINAKELNDFVTNRDQGAFAFNQVSLDALYKRDLKVSALTQAGKSAQLTAQPTKITADVDVQQLSKAMSKNKAVEVTNTAALGEAIAAQLSKRINPRQVI